MITPALPAPPPAAPPKLVIIRHLPPRRGERPMVKLVDPRNGAGPELTIARAAMYLAARGFCHQPGSNGIWQIV